MTKDIAARPVRPEDTRADAVFGATAERSEAAPPLQGEEKQTEQPGSEAKMHVKPLFLSSWYRPAGKLQGRTALITGGDSGIGRSVALHFALEGCSHVIITATPQEREDALETKRLIEESPQQLFKEAREHERIRQERTAATKDGEWPEWWRNAGHQIPEVYTPPKESKCRCTIVEADFNGGEPAILALVDQILAPLPDRRLDILVLNAAEQFMCETIMDITADQIESLFRVNVFAPVYLTKAMLPHMARGSTILVSTSVVAYRGHPYLLDYSMSKSALLAFIRSLSGQLVKKGIRVNGVAPGPIVTPLIPASFPSEKFDVFGRETVMKRAGEPCECAPCYVFLASQDASYLTGQVMHPNGGSVINA